MQWLNTRGQPSSRHVTKGIDFHVGSDKGICFFSLGHVSSSGVTTSGNIAASGGELMLAEV